MLSGKTLLDYTKLFSTNDYKMNDKIIFKYFKEKYGKPWLYTKKIDGTRNYLLDKIKHNDLMGEKHKKVCRALNHFEYVFIFISPVRGCISISPFASFVGAPVGTGSSEVGIKICAITAVNEKYKSVIKENRKKHDKLVMLAKTKLNTI